MKAEVGEAMRRAKENVGLTCTYSDKCETYEGCCATVVRLNYRAHAGHGRGGETW